MTTGTRHMCTACRKPLWPLTSMASQAAGCVGLLDIMHVLTYHNFTSPGACFGATSAPEKALYTMK